MFKNVKHKELSKNIANIFSFLPSLWSDIKINLKENENKLNDENLKYYEKKYAMLEIERKNYLSKKKFETETNLHKTYILNMLIILLAIISVSLTLFGTNILDNIIELKTVIKMKSGIGIMLMFSIMFIGYFLSSQLGLIKQKFNNLFKLSIVIILSCITVSVYFNFMFLQSILTIDNNVIKIIIALLKSILLDVSISVLLFYRNCRQTLSFSYETEVKTENKTEHKTEIKTEIKTDYVKPKIEVKTDNKTENKTDYVKPKTDNKNITVKHTFDEKLKMIKNVINNLEDNEKIDIQTMKHFLTRYDWDKAKKILQNEGIIYIHNRKCLKTPNNKRFEIIK